MGIAVGPRTPGAITTCCSCCCCSGLEEGNGIEDGRGTATSWSKSAVASTPLLCCFIPWSFFVLDDAADLVFDFGGKATVDVPFATEAIRRSISSASDAAAP